MENDLTQKGQTARCLAFLLWAFHSTYNHCSSAERERLYD
jgi:hypothetical protein